jgi:hypothetical protein
MMNIRPISLKTGFLSEDALRSAAPSVFADTKHVTRSERYTYLPTIDIVRGLAREGFRPVSARQTTPRDEGKAGHCKHMLRFRRTQDIEMIESKLGSGHFISRGSPLAEFPEVVLVNSHDGSSAYEFMAGIFRLICANGLIVGSATMSAKVRHSGNIQDAAIEAAYTVARQFEGTMNAAEEMKRITLAPAEALILAEESAALRFDLEPGEASPIAPAKFLDARRIDDRKPDLWTTFNTIQENAIQGGLRGKVVQPDGRKRNTRTREVKGIDASVRLNRSLWSLAEKMAALKK